MARTRRLEIRQNDEDGDVYVLYLEDDEVKALCGPMKVDDLERMTQASWALTLKAFDAGDWTADKQPIDWANEQTEWGRTLYVTEDEDQIEGIVVGAVA